MKLLPNRRGLVSLIDMDRICAIVLVLLFCFVLLFRKRRRSRQKRNIRTAERILDKLKCFSGSNRRSCVLSYLRKIDPFVFEELLLNAFRNKGYEIKRNERYTHDGGIDGRISLNGSLFLIQAKRYRSYVNPRHIRDFYFLIQRTEGVDKGFFIHTGRTGRDTFRQYKDTCIEIISGDKLIDLILKK